MKELDIALAEGRIDCCVHSLKDMPMEENPEFPITTLPKRGDPRDVLVLPQTQHFEDITSQIGSSSFRRQIQLKSCFLPAIACLYEAISLPDCKNWIAENFFFGIGRCRITACGII